MKNFLIITATLLLIITAITCKKSNTTSSNNNQNTGKPQSTAVGTPVGNPTSKMIGANGGIIVSADSSVELDIPAGALSNDMTISIQPITNNCPGGIVSAYRFSPNGLQFKQPATLKFHYPDTILNSTLAQLMGIAVQDSNGYWRAANKVINDTVSRTISASIKHFTDYSPMELMELYSVFHSLKVNDISLLRISLNTLDESEDNGGENYDDFEKYLVNYNGPPIIWTVNGETNGSPQYGTIEPDPFIKTSGKYTAPATIPSNNNPVQISAMINMTLSYNDQNFNKIAVFTNILIYGGGYQVTIIFQAEVNESGTYWNWTDTGRFDVVMTGKNMGAVQNIKNYPASFHLDSSNTTCTVSLIPPPPSAPIFIIDSGIVAFSPIDSSITIIFKATDPKNYIQQPTFKYDCGANNTGLLGGGLGPPFPVYLQFDRSDAVLQTIFLTPQYKMEVRPIQ